ncbi:unnamed protein product [Kuraishia capsulata CBS 1993]|uniref:PCI domain-containing protein n=1 Tax=Kuraishia capsulata CBS 1993 TaxID=1382522 RepID=W6MGW5_9ASCO|nr:uncharacterized protein KUCA_T00001409001 [Kuraishia capsulata CBS 1993]CDK25439.1 unnamed protein product [Kuraishia capsulata CBS 1993]
MSFAIVLDRYFSESLSEYAVLLDAYTETTEYSEKFADLDENSPGVYQQVLSTLDVLNSLKDKDFEATYNLLIHILTLSGEAESLIKESGLLEKLVDLAPESDGLLAHSRSSVKATTIISVLSSIFNLIPETSALRIAILKDIILVTKKSSSASLLLPITDNLKLWFEAAGASQDEVKVALVDLATLFAAEYPKESLRLSKIIVTSLPNVTNEDATTLIGKVLSSGDITDIYSYASIPAVKALASGSEFDQKVSQLVTICNSVELAQYEQFQTANSEVFAKLNVSPEQLYNRLRVLVISKWATKKQTLPYSKISTELSIPEDQVEEYIINCIKAGVLEGKLNQSSQVFYVHRVSVVGDFGLEQWKLIRAKLNTWKGSLKAIKETVDQAKTKKRAGQPKEQKVAA